MVYTAHYSSPVGEMTLAGDGEHLIGLWLEGQKYFENTLPKDSTVDENSPIPKKTKAWLDRYFAGRKPPISELPLAPVGSEFRREVWRVLCEIPYGGLMTYGEIAQKLAAETGRARMSAQAVGGAVGHNPISVIIPCHRVVGTNGSLTGYAGGIETKLKLLKLEGADLTGLFMPHRGTAL